MSGDDHITPPPVLWAQEANNILLTVCLEDCIKPDIKIDNDKIYFKGVGGSDKKTHEVTINLYKEIDPEKSQHFVRERVIEFSLRKKEKGPFWPQLTKEKVKYHWLKVDFNKWKDSDEEEEDNMLDWEDDGNLKNVLLQKMDLNKDSVEDYYNENDNENADSDDADLPDLE